MPSARPKAMNPCPHRTLHLTPSPHAAIAGYTQRTPQQLFTAATGKRKLDTTQDPPPSTFPTPLVLPGDELALDPRYPGQSFGAWLNEPARNEVTSARGVIYVAAPPSVDAGLCLQLPYVAGARKAENAAAGRDSTKSSSSPSLLPDATPAMDHSPPIDDIITHLAAFYHGMPVKLLPTPLRFTHWHAPAQRRSTRHPTHPSSLPNHIALATSASATRIRIRTHTDAGITSTQLNLPDLLSAAVALLPADAYALLLVLAHDLYEDAADAFVCGRAYGGSRVAAVSGARYAPLLDAPQGVERGHAWPGSHCAAFVAELSGETHTQKRRQKQRRRQEVHGEYAPPKEVSGSGSGSGLGLDEGRDGSPMQAALAAHRALSAPAPSAADLASLHLARVVRTAAHELAHCFGLDHCVFYACTMQGTASLVEDNRQPGYFCPVCVAKLGAAVVGGDGVDRRRWEGERYEKIREACEAGGRAGFAALEAWVGRRVLALEGGGGRVLDGAAEGGRVGRGGGR